MTGPQQQQDPKGAVVPQDGLFKVRQAKQVTAAGRALGPRSRRPIPPPRSCPLAFSRLPAPLAQVLYPDPHSEAQFALGLFGSVGECQRALDVLNSEGRRAARACLMPRSQAGRSAGCQVATAGPRTPLPGAVKVTGPALVVPEMGSSIEFVGA